MSLMNGKHWSAVLVNMKTSVFYFIDPLGTSQDTANKYFKNWVQYYNNRKDALLTRKWSNILVQQPIQQDSYNCAVYSCLFIQQLINNGSVSTIQQDMYLIRQQMAASIAFYKSFEMNVL
jgi:Ulp1 family protease